MNETVKAPEKRWYVIHTYSGYENKVKANLEHRIESMGMEDKVFQVLVPMEDEIEIKQGQRHTVQKKVFPGYLYVRCFLDDHSWDVIRNTPGVTGFVGSQGKPVALSRLEVERIRHKTGFEKPKPRTEFSEGQSVRVTAGPLADFTGTIAEINLDQNKLKVMVSIFGRETPVELQFDQVGKL